VALSYWAIGDIYLALGRLDEARAHHDRARALREELVRGNPHGPNMVEHLAYSYHGMGVLHTRTGQRTEALRDLREALRLRAQFVRDDPDHIWWRYDRARTEVNLAVPCSD
jgi:tetratricopeptide (TPR) repeat protein